jgi:hypothetical protein
MIWDHLETAIDRADAMAAEGALHLWLQREGVDLDRFVDEGRMDTVKRLMMTDPRRLPDFVTIEFLRGLTVGVLAARHEQEASVDGEVEGLLAASMVEQARELGSVQASSLLMQGANAIERLRRNVRDLEARLADG